MVPHCVIGTESGKFTYNIYFSQHPVRKCYYLHISNDNTEVQRGHVNLTCSYSKWVVMPSKPKLLIIHSTVMCKRQSVNFCILGLKNIEMKIWKWSLEFWKWAYSCVITTLCRRTPPLEITVLWPSEAEVDWTENPPGIVEHTETHSGENFTCLLSVVLYASFSCLVYD